MSWQGGPGYGRGRGRGGGRGGYRWRRGWSQGWGSGPQPQQPAPLHVQQLPPGYRRIAAVVDEDNGLDSRISPTYGRAPYIALVDLDPQGNIVAVNIVPNPAVNTPQGAGPATTQYILSTGATTIIASNIGPNAQAFLRQYGVQVVTVPPGTPLKQALRTIGIRT